MRSSDRASRTWSASRSSRFWVPSQREYRARGRMVGVTRLHLGPGLDIENLEPAPHELLQLAGPADERRKGAEVHGHDHLRPEQLDRFGGPLGAHRVVVADRQEDRV